MGEGVLVADDVAGRPPGGDVRMRGVRRKDRAEAAVRAFFDVQLKLVQAFKVEDQRAKATIDLEAQIILAARRKACRFNRADSTSGKAHEVERRIVYVNRRFFSRAGKWALGDEGLEQARGFCNLAY